MVRTYVAAALAAVVVLSSTARAQCHAGAAAAGQSTAALTGRTAALGNSGVLTPGLVSGQGSGQNSLAAMLQAQMMYQQLMQQQQAMLAAQQKSQAEQLAARKYRAEQSRAKTAEARQRTYARIAAENGQASKAQQRLLASYQPTRR